jgi:hypothetical protein
MVEKWEKKKFRVFKVQHKKGYWLVTLKQWHRPNYEKLKYECLPDSVYVGKTIWL